MLCVDESTFDCCSLTVHFLGGLISSPRPLTHAHAARVRAGSFMRINFGRRDCFARSLVLGRLLYIVASTGRSMAQRVGERHKGADSNSVMTLTWKPSAISY